MKSSKILILSRHSIVRHGLRLMLQASTGHAIATDGRPLIHFGEILAQHDPELLILDVDQQESLAPVVAYYEAAAPACKLLLLGASPETLRTDASFLGATRWADALVTASGDPMDVLVAINAVANDNPPVERPLDPVEVSASTTTITFRPDLNVTPREQQVMELIRQGNCNKRIARALGISVTTVRTHRQKLMAKLGLRNAVEIARFAEHAAGGGFQAAPLRA